MNNVFKTILVAFPLFFIEGALAQTRFKAAAFSGVNLSQVDGDKQDGYLKAGLSLGLNGSVFIRPNFDLSTEIIYNVKGAKPKPNYNRVLSNYYSYLTFHYSEIALLSNFYFKPNKSKTYYTESIHIGLSYGRLLKSSMLVIKDNQPLDKLETEVTSQFNPHDLSFVLGFSQLFTKRVGITIRHTTSVNLLYNNPNYNFFTNKEGFKHFQPFFFSFHVFYNLISPNKVMGLRVKKKKVNDNPLEELY